MTTRDLQELRLMRRYHQHHDVDARDELVTLGLPLVRSIARRYAGRAELIDDLVQVGCLGLLKAIDRFDLDAGHRFVTFAAPTISGEIKRHFRDHGWMVHVPRGVQELDARVTRASDALLAETGRPPTAAAIATQLREPVDAVEEAIQGGKAYRALSLSHPVGESGSPLDTLGQSDRGYAEAETRDLLRRGYEVLDPRDRQILWMRYYEGLFQREIAAEIGVSQMQVSRLLQRAVERMQVHLTGTARLN